MKTKRNTAKPLEDTLAGFFKFRLDLTGAHLETAVWAALGFDAEALQKALITGRSEAEQIFSQPGPPPAKGRFAMVADLADGFSEAQLKQLSEGLLNFLRFRELLTEGVKRGSEPGMAALFMATLFSTLSLQSLAKSEAALARKWAGKLLVWPGLYSPVKAYRKKLEQKLRKVVGQDVAVGPQFGRSAEGELELDAMVSMLWVVAITSWFDAERFQANPKLATLRQLSWATPVGNRLLAETITNFLEQLHEASAYEEPALRSKASVSERRRVFRAAAHRASQVLAQHPQTQK